MKHTHEPDAPLFAAFDPPKFAGIREAMATPPHNGTATSREAAEAIKPCRNAQTRTVLDWLRLRVAGGTREEIAAGTCVALASVCARVAELLASGDVEERGTRPTRSGRNAAVVYARSERKAS